MSWRRSLLSLGVAAALVVGAGGLAVPAQAAGSSVTLGVAYASVTKGTTEKFTYTGEKVPSGAKAYLVRKSGSTWVTVRDLGTRTKGSVTVTPGWTTSWRVVFKKSGKNVATSAARKVVVKSAPTLTLRGTSTRISTGSSAKFTYVAKGLASGQTVRLQRKYGSTWKNVQTLTPVTTAKALTPPTLGTLGKYPYRVVVHRGSTFVKASSSVNVYAYGTVPIALFDDYFVGGVVQVGPRLFTYNSESDWTELYPEYRSYQPFEDSPTSCRSLSIQFAGDEDAQEDGRVSYLKVVQSASDPVYASTPAGVVGALKVTLDGGPLEVGVAMGPSSSSDVVVHTTGSCYTQSGLR